MGSSPTGNSMEEQGAMNYIADAKRAGSECFIVKLVIINGEVIAVRIPTK